ncbi:MAG TPA: LamG-like jellyroll fold domain-containing protein, partial [Marinagarivorans sp.]
MRLFIQKLLPAMCAAFLLTGCNDNQPAEKIAAPNEPVVTVDSSQSADASSRGASEAWLTVKSQEYGDSGVIVNLQASVADGEVPAEVSWVQVSGPDVVLVNPNQLGAEVVLPWVTEPTRMAFEITASRGGETLVAQQTVVALPLVPRAEVVNPVLTGENNTVAIDLAEPVAANTAVSIVVSGGSAVEGVDFAALPTTVTTVDGTRIEIPIQVLPSNRSEDVYTKIVMRAGDGGDPIVVTVVIPANVAEAVAAAASSSALAASSAAAASSAISTAPESSSSDTGFNIPSSVAFSSSSFGDFIIPSSISPPSSVAVSSEAVSSSETASSNQAVSSSEAIVVSSEASISSVGSSSVVVASSSSSQGGLDDEIDFSLFSDPALRECVTGTGQTRISELTSLQCGPAGITDASGIEQLTALTELFIYSNELTTIDVSANTALTHLRLSNNHLTSIDVSANTALTDLFLGFNQFTALDVSTNTALVALGFEDNELTTIDVSANIALETLRIQNNLIPCSEIQDLIAKFSTVNEEDCVSPNVPDSFTFNAQTDVEFNSFITSNTIMVAGISSSVPITIMDGEYSLDGGETFTAEPGMVEPNAEVLVRVLSSDSFSESTQATLDIGGITGTFRVTTRTPRVVTDAYLAMDGDVGSSDIIADGIDVDIVGSPVISDVLVASGTSLSINSTNYLTVPSVVLGDGDWTVEFWLNVTEYAAGGYAIPLMQLGTAAEGAGGFGLSLFSNHSGAKQLYLRQSYSGLVGATLPVGLNTPVHIAIVMRDGEARVVAGQTHWSGAIALTGDFTQPQRLSVGSLNGAWLQSRSIYIDDVAITSGEALYEQVVVSSSAESSRSSAQESSSSVAVTSSSVASSESVSSALASQSSSSVVINSSESFSSLASSVEASSSIVASSSEGSSSSSVVESSSSTQVSASSASIVSSATAESSLIAISSSSLASSSSAESSSEFSQSSNSTGEPIDWGPMDQGLNSGALSSIQDIATDGNGVWIAVFEGGYAARSTDDGVTWSPLERGLNSGSATEAIFGVATDGNGVWVAVAESGYAARSTDNGITWSPLER